MVVSILSERRQKFQDFLSIFNPSTGCDVIKCRLTWEFKISCLVQQKLRNLDRFQH